MASEVELEGGVDLEVGVGGELPLLNRAHREVTAPAGTVGHLEDAVRPESGADIDGHGGDTSALEASHVGLEMDPLVPGHGGVAGDEDVDPLAHREVANSAQTPEIDREHERLVQAQIAVDGDEAGEQLGASALTPIVERPFDPSTVGREVDRQAFDAFVRDDLDFELGEAPQASFGPLGAVTAYVDGVRSALDDAELGENGDGVGALPDTDTDAERNFALVPTPGTGHPLDLALLGVRDRDQLFRVERRDEDLFGRAGRWLRRRRRVTRAGRRRLRLDGRLRLGRRLPAVGLVFARSDWFDVSLSESAWSMNSGTETGNETANSESASRAHSHLSRGGPGQTSASGPIMAPERRAGEFAGAVLSCRAMSSFRAFTLAGVPVDISPWFFLLCLWALGYGGWGWVWIVCLAVSLLVHEMGHAMVARHYRLGPAVLLHGLGGLCSHERSDSDGKDALIVAAGPAAGLILGGISYAVLLGVGGWKSPLLAARPQLWTTLSSLIYINVFWSLVNLLPIWPLDGGQLYRLGLLRLVRPLRAEKVTHLTGIVIGGVGVGLSWRYLGTLGVLIFGLTVWENVQVLRGQKRSGPVRAQHRHSRELVAQAKAAYAGEDWRECSRLCHQIRTESTVPANVLNDVWRLLALATGRQGNRKEAISYLRRAPFDAEIAEEWYRCLLSEKRMADLEELVASKEWKRLGATRLAEIQARIEADLE